MKTRSYLIFVTLLLLCFANANAHDFEVDGIYYNITSSSNKTVEVTYRGTSFDQYSNEYTGSVVIPSSVTYNGTTYSVTTIGSEAFYSCSGLTSVTIPNSVTSIENYAFIDCSRLTSVTIPNSVTSIGNGAFYYCYDLTSVTIPNSVTSIGYQAFYKCTGLTSVTIGNSVTTIRSEAFYYCTGLKEIYVKADTPPSAYSSIFSGVTTNSATLYVPVGSKDAYAAANGWSEFYNIVEMEFTGIDEVVDDVKGENSKVKDVYDLSGRKVTNPTKGIYIVNGKKVLLK